MNLIIMIVSNWMNEFQQCFPLCVISSGLHDVIIYTNYFMESVYDAIQLIRAIITFFFSILDVPRGKPRWWSLLKKVMRNVHLSSFNMELIRLHEIEYEIYCIIWISFHLSYIFVTSLTCIRLVNQRSIMLKLPNYALKCRWIFNSS